MQPVNVLPTFISQDTDSKAKDYLGSSDGQDKDDGFSRLVEQHVSEESKTTINKYSQEQVTSTTANNGNTIAESDKNDTGELSGRQESDSSAQDSTGDEGNTNPESAENTSSNNAQENTSDSENSPNNEALTESEQFISLLYNSDQTLTNTLDRSKQSDQVKTANSANKQTVVVDTEDVVETRGKVNQYGVEANENGKSNGRNSAEMTFDHKLKAFSKDELLIRAQLKEGAVTQQASGQVLKDYQQSLQSQQSLVKNQSITSEKLMNTQRVNGQLNNKISDLAPSISPASKSQFTEQVDSGLYQLPVEPIGKGELMDEEVPTLLKELATKSNSQLATDVSDKVKIAESKIAKNAVEAVNNKTSKSEPKTAQVSNVSDLQPGKANIDKVITERNSAVSLLAENITKAQSVQGQEKQPVMSSAQVQALQQAQAQQKTQSIVSETESVENAGEDFIDAMLMAEDTPLEQSVKTVSKLDNTATRSVAEAQALSIQATQNKQSNDAYSEHQVSEVLNHNVASDIAQIQKSNVQLQQETIAIFRKDFADAVKDKVMIMINQKLQQFDITLDPPEFGNMQVRVNLQGEQAAVNFVVQNQQAKEALEENMHKLKEMLAEQGVDVGGANVEQQSQQQSNDENNMKQNNDNASLLASENEGADNVEHVLSARLFDSSATGVDYYA
ncbi:flagellar hook-length control protein FliK [Colwellia psychrerythraea]|uniref:Flagellar hook-length control protein-like protein n=1 Tax=Colwellia psychrerythraea TaxID=28229 RepID=A0A099L2E0_COLPS|nr:flagellar hook-length control protein FliK [Colwellia psychrerythraea]KGJ97026.1 Flagellar hook-length control protein-like protein [Colwellia psychrerythraea]